MEVQYIERVIQTLPVYLKLLAFHFQDQLFIDKTSKIIMPNPPPQTSFQKPWTRQKKKLTNEIKNPCLITAL